MLFFYDAGISAYTLLAKAASPFHPKAKLWVKGREKLLQQIEATIGAESAPVAWFHCASLGEFEQGRPIIEALRANYPGWKICLTFFSPSGYEVRKNYAGADYVFYLPPDSAANAKAFLNSVKPKIAFFVKYEFWFHYLSELQQRHIPALSVSAIFRPGQIFFKPYGGFYRNMLRKFTHLFVQNAESANLLKSIGITNCTVAGDTRFDRVSEVARSAKEIPVAAAFASTGKVIVIGSSWPQDIEHLMPFMKARQDLKFIIAPHEIKEAEIALLEKNFPGETARFTTSAPEAVSGKRILLVNTIGVLSSLYQYGHFAYIGGAFGAGLHNTLEAATFGLPLFFGPEYEKFQEAKDLIMLGGAFTINSSQELESAFQNLNSSSEAYKTASAACKQYVAHNTGATKKIMDFATPILNSNAKPSI